MKTIITLLTILLAQGANASFLEACELETQILSVGKLNTAGIEQPHDSKKVDVKILGVKDNGGHTDCQHFVGTKQTFLLQSVSLWQLVSLEPGYRANLNYFHVNSMTPTGVMSSTSVKLMGPALSAYKAAFEDKVAYAAIAEVQDKVSIDGRPVKLISGKATYLPEGLCGFAGCSSVYLITLTYADELPNSPALSAVIKVHLNPNNEPTQITVLK